ncbi:MAG TPA: nitrate reductase molybdenum cofactor assembly chaperone [Actinomycetes bacterium]
MNRDRATSWPSTWQVASVLLGYPDDALAEELPVLAEEVADLPDVAATPLRRFLEHARNTATLDLARHYVETFDHKRRCCLYLTYYAHGDTRKRGVALLEFKMTYRAAGLELRPDELPDHLAVVLEYAALEPRGGRQLLLDHRAGVELLRLALEDARSPYADVVRAVTATLPALAGDEREAVHRLAVQGPPTEEVGLAPFAPPEAMPVSLPFPTRRPVDLTEAVRR